MIKDMSGFDLAWILTVRSLVLSALAASDKFYYKCDIVYVTYVTNVGFYFSLYFVCVCRGVMPVQQYCTIVFAVFRFPLYEITPITRVEHVHF